MRRVSLLRSGDEGGLEREPIVLSFARANSLGLWDCDCKSGWELGHRGG